MSTSLEAEQTKQRRWQLRPQFAHLSWFDRLVVNEFLPAEAQAVEQARRLQQIVGFAVKEVPHYRDLFHRQGLKPEDIRQPSDLVQLPSLTRRQVRELGAALEAQQLPAGQVRGSPTETSGTTGEPVVVQHTAHSHLMFTLLKQRNDRWANFDPLGLYAAIYGPSELPRLPDGSLALDGATVRVNSWPLVGKFFVTGPYVGFDSRCPRAQQVAWLDEHRPRQLLSMSSNLEQLALAFQDHDRPDYLRSLRGVAQQLTPAMRRTIETILQVPVHQSYGFNEIGIVATECQEGRRFHVHTEHCLLEIVGPDGRPSPPGEFGRILVTGLSNTAMPLVRYEPDDLAMAVEGPCPCGRTLPSFGAIQGRYSRIAFLPPGVWRHWIGLQSTVGSMPMELLQPLRQYQVHHHRDGRFVLKLAVAGTLSPEFMKRIEAEWREADREHVFPLEVVEVAEIPHPAGMKFLNFTSDVIPPPDWGPPPADVNREAFQ